MLLRIFAIIIGFILMVLTLFGIYEESSCTSEFPAFSGISSEAVTEPESQISPAADVSMDASEIFDAAPEPVEIDHTISFGNGYSISVPGQMLLTDKGENGISVISGCNESTDEAFVLRSITLEEPLTLSELEELCQGFLEDVAIHSAGDLVYLTGYDAENETDLCIFTDDNGTEIYVIGLYGTSDDMPASQFFQSLQQ